MPEFEFDDEKSQLNKRKHGIDFVEAQALWLDQRRAEVPARTADEPRFLVVARWDHRHWTAVITYRKEKVRIISVRPAREEEVVLYEG